MNVKELPENIIAELVRAQKNEITEYHIYTRLSKKVKDIKNSTVLSKIADDEMRHYNTWKKITGREVKPSRWKIFKFYWISRILGLTFGIKLMERGEESANVNYNEMTGTVPGAKHIAKEEDEHEKMLIDMIEEERLNYMGSVVLGLNDALVELTGALAGMTLALQNSRLIALAGLITGIAASFSMAASEYLSQKAEESETALKSSLYTGTAYIFTVAFLILPYLILDNYFLSLGITLSIAVFIIFIFNYYISVAKELNFRRRFVEMTIISLGVSAISFGIGMVVRKFLPIDI